MPFRMYTYNDGELDEVWIYYNNRFIAHFAFQGAIFFAGEYRYEYVSPREDETFFNWESFPEFVGEMFPAETMVFA